MRDKTWSCFAVVAVVLVMLPSCTAQGSAVKDVEKYINTSSSDMMSAVIPISGFNLKLTVRATVVWGDEIDVYTMNEGNYNKFTEVNEDGSVKCNYTVSNGGVEVYTNLSESSIQGFQSPTDFPIDEDVDKVFVVAGYRDQICYSTNFKGGLVELEVTLGSAIPPEIRNIIIMGAVVITFCGALGLCQYVYKKRLSEKERYQEGIKQAAQGMGEMEAAQQNAISTSI